ncbi:MAG: hypothetical protein ACK4NZ_12875 [Tsuneonella sp.]
MHETSDDDDARSSVSGQSDGNGIGPVSEGQTEGSAGSSEQASQDDARTLDDKVGHEAQTEGGQSPEDVEDRPMVGSVTPDDYPKDLLDH